MQDQSSITSEMQKAIFPVTELINVVCVKYDQPSYLDKPKPFILDISFEGIDSDGQEIGYVCVTSYSTPGTRDAAYAEFDQRAADKIYRQGVKAINKATSSAEVDDHQQIQDSLLIPYRP